VTAISDINAFLLNLRNAGTLPTTLHDQSPSGASNKRQKVIEEYRQDLSDVSSYLPLSVSARSSADINQRPINTPHLVSAGGEPSLGLDETRTNLLHVFLGTGLSTENLLLHLVADEWSGSGAWVDLSSNAFSLAPGGTNAPSKVVAGLGGSAGVEFTGNSSYFEIDGPDAALSDLSGKVTYIVFTATEQVGVTDDVPSINTDSNSISNISGAGDFEVFAARNINGSISIKTLSAYNTPVSLETGATSQGNDLIFIADDPTTNNLTNKKMAEVAIYSATHTDDEMLTNLNSLYSKYSLQTS